MRQRALARKAKDVFDKGGWLQGLGHERKFSPERRSGNNRPMAGVRSRTPESPKWWRQPFLQPGEEIELVKRWRDNGDHAAKDRLVTAHLPLVHKCARKYPTLDRDEAMAAGCLGLIKALAKFDPALGTFRTYAEPWVTNEIRETARWTRSVVWAPKSKKLSALQRAIVNLEKQPPSRANWAQIQLLKQQLEKRTASTVSLNAPMGSDESSQEWQDALEDDANTPPDMVWADNEERINRRKALEMALKTLNERERLIFGARRLAEEPPTLDELAQQFNISRERVRQIEVAAECKVTAATLENLERVEVTAPGAAT